MRLLRILATGQFFRDHKLQLNAVCHNAVCDPVVHLCRDPAMVLGMLITQGRIKFSLDHSPETKDFAGTAAARLYDLVSAQRTTPHKDKQHMSV